MSLYFCIKSIVEIERKKTFFFVLNKNTYNLLQHYLCKSHSKYKIYKIYFDSCVFIDLLKPSGKYMSHLF
jgi:hypothetical protein